MISPLTALSAQMREVDVSSLGVPRTKFVYALFSEGEIVYVGQTASLAPRLLQHRVGGTPFCAAKTFDRAFALELPAEDAAAYEGALIRRFNPPLCVGAPKDESRDAEVLARLGLDYDQSKRDAFADRRRKAFTGVRKLARRNRLSWRVSTSRVIWRATKRYLKRIEKRSQRAASDLVFTVHESTVGQSNSECSDSVHSAADSNAVQPETQPNAAKGAA